MLDGSPKDSVYRGNKTVEGILRVELDATSMLAEGPEKVNADMIAFFNATHKALEIHSGKEALSVIHNHDLCLFSSSI
jgi:hypothetical protein